jgi:hypothetical protein
MSDKTAEKAWTQGQVRETFVRGREQHADFPGINNSRVEFESWLAAHDAEVRDAALKEAESDERCVHGVDGPDWAGLRELPTPKPDYEALIEEFVATITPALTNETHAWNLWNILASDTGALRSALLRAYRADAPSAGREIRFADANQMLAEAGVKQGELAETIRARDHEITALRGERDALQARLDAMTVEWGYRDGLDGRVTVEDEEHARRIGQKYSDTYETVSRLVGPWTVVPEGDTNA